MNLVRFLKFAYCINFKWWNLFAVALSKVGSHDKLCISHFIDHRPMLLQISLFSSRGWWAYTIIVMSLLHCNVTFLCVCCVFQWHIQAEWLSHKLPADYRQSLCTIVWSDQWPCQSSRTSLLSLLCKAFCDSVLLLLTLVVVSSSSSYNARILHFVVILRWLY